MSYGFMLFDVYLIDQAMLKTNYYLQNLWHVFDISLTFKNSRNAYFLTQKLFLMFLSR